MASNSRRMPSVFVSHNSPMTALEPKDTKDPLAVNLYSLGKDMVARKPKAIVVVSAHWDYDGRGVQVSTAPEQGPPLETIYDFGGFPDALFRIKYEPPGSPEVAARALELLKSSGIPARPSKRGLDHGVWVPLLKLFPDANVPVVAVSLSQDENMKAHLELGKALAPLRDEGVIIVGSGAALHNLRVAFGAIMSRTKTVNPAWVRAFDDALEGAMKAGGGTSDEGDDKEANKQERERLQHQALLALGKHADLRSAHPTLEHLLPAYVAAGAGVGDACRRWNESFRSYDMTMSNACYVFE